MNSVLPNSQQDLYDKYDISNMLTKYTLMFMEFENKLILTDEEKEFFVVINNALEENAFTPRCVFNITRSQNMGKLEKKTKELVQNIMNGYENVFESFQTDDVNMYTEVVKLMKEQSNNGILYKDGDLGVEYTIQKEWTSVKNQLGNIQIDQLGFIGTSLIALGLLFLIRTSKRAIFLYLRTFDKFDKDVMDEEKDTKRKSILRGMIEILQFIQSFLKGVVQADKSASKQLCSLIEKIYSNNNMLKDEVKKATNAKQTAEDAKQKVLNDNLNKQLDELSKNINDYIITLTNGNITNLQNNATEYRDILNNLKKLAGNTDDDDINNYIINITAKIDGLENLNNVFTQFNQSNDNNILETLTSEYNKIKNLYIRFQENVKSIYETQNVQQKVALASNANTLGDNIKKDSDLFLTKAEGVESSIKQKETQINNSILALLQLVNITKTINNTNANSSIVTNYINDVENIKQEIEVLKNNTVEQLSKLNVDVLKLELSNAYNISNNFLQMFDKLSNKLKNSENNELVKKLLEQPAILNSIVPIVKNLNYLFSNVSTGSNVTKYSIITNIKVEYGPFISILLNFKSLYNNNVNHLLNLREKLKDTLFASSSTYIDMLLLYEEMSGSVRVIVKMLDKVKLTSQMGGRKRRQCETKHNTNNVIKKIKTLIGGTNSGFVDNYSIQLDNVNNTVTFEYIKNIHDTFYKDDEKNIKVLNDSTNYRFGPFYKVVDQKISTDKIVEEALNFKVLNDLIINKGTNLILYTYGYSGSGKTYTLFGDLAKSETWDNGVVWKLIKKLMENPNISIELEKTIKIYGYLKGEVVDKNINYVFLDNVVKKDLMSNSKSSNSNSNNANIINNLIQKWANTINNDLMQGQEDKTKDDNKDDVLNLSDIGINNQFLTPTQTDNMIKTETNKIKGIRDKKKQVFIKPTSNNPSSSRGFYVLKFKIVNKINNNTSYLGVVDMAGNEDPYDIASSMTPSMSLDKMKELVLDEEDVFTYDLIFETIGNVIVEIINSIIRVLNALREGFVSERVGNNILENIKIFKDYPSFKNIIEHFNIFSKIKNKTSLFNDPVDTIIQNLILYDDNKQIINIKTIKGEKGEYVYKTYIYDRLFKQFNFKQFKNNEKQYTVYLSDFLWILRTSATIFNLNMTINKKIILEILYKEINEKYKNVLDTVIDTLPIDIKIRLKKDDANKNITFLTKYSCEPTNKSPTNKSATNKSATTANNKIITEEEKSAFFQNVNIGINELSMKIKERAVLAKLEKEGENAMSLYKCSILTLILLQLIKTDKFENIELKNITSTNVEAEVKQTFKNLAVNYLLPYDGTNYHRYYVSSQIIKEGFYINLANAELINYFERKRNFDLDGKTISKITSDYEFNNNFDFKKYNKFNSTFKAVKNTNANNTNTNNKDKIKYQTSLVPTLINEFNNAKDIMFACIRNDKDLGKAMGAIDTLLLVQDLKST
jgi:hypothetical protein